MGLLYRKEGAHPPGSRPTSRRGKHDRPGPWLGEAPVDRRRPGSQNSQSPAVLLILVDDVGFGATSPFGGPVPTPALDRLAQNGLRGIGMIPCRIAILAVWFPI